MIPVLTSGRGVTLIGGGTVDAADLAEALALAPDLVAADGGADRALALGHRPLAVVGDLDSLSPEGRSLLAGVLHPVSEQDTTDFEKCLLRISAPVVLAVGFAGPRVDHLLAALNTLARRVGPPTVILSGSDVVLACPPRVCADLPPGTRLSLMPLGAATVSGHGLRWPVDGIAFAPDGRTGASNEVTGPLDLSITGPMLLILPRTELKAALRVAQGG